MYFKLLLSEFKKLVILGIRGIIIINSKTVTGYDFKAFIFISQLQSIFLIHISLKIRLLLLVFLELDPLV